MANDSFGIEHPLVTVHDIDAVAARYEALGFAPTALGRHPWGTVNRLVMFPDNFIELIAIGDPDAIARDPVGGQKFGRRVRDRLALGEGISLLALRSPDAATDEQAAVARGAASDGRVDFRRAVRLPDGTQDEAVVTLAILPDEAMPGLTMFLCQQHKPQLVWNPDWLAHPNGADAITAVTYFAPDPLAVMPRAVSLWGESAVMREQDGLRVSTPGGLLHIFDADAIDTRFPGMPLLPEVFARAPCGVAISVHCASFETARNRAREVRGAVLQEGRVLIPPDYAGGVILELHV
ncbi:MAG TPA: VOC family protein [Acetobacteraceae bacterium]|jgi:hypothetical protein|nr:VOC family protein [Acetobacteraceae bacterium]